MFEQTRDTLGGGGGVTGSQLRCGCGERQGVAGEKMVNFLTIIIQMDEEVMLTGVSCCVEKDVCWSSPGERTQVTAESTRVCVCVCTLPDWRSSGCSVPSRSSSSADRLRRLSGFSL